MEETPDRISAAAGVRFRDLGGEAVLLELETGRYFGLDEVATRMWALLAEHGEVAPALEALIREYDAPTDQLRDDLLGFIAELEGHRLIRRDPS